MFLLVSFTALAKHIVGGELELLHLNGFKYRINLIYYFDVTNNPGRDPVQQEPNVTVYIYRKADNIMVDSVLLPWSTRTQVQYTNPTCSSDGIRSDRLLYSSEVTLSSDKYSHPGGYYMMWARCCRNYTIDNIKSDDPNALGGTAAGQVFYLEFPAVMSNGSQFINSSPKNFPTLSDYACPKRPYYVDFAGTDDDGDSLVYSLATPLSTFTSEALPAPEPGPYLEVEWQTGYSLNNVMNYSLANTWDHDLEINKDGFLRVTPKDLGLYVFAVKVEEYRNKQKIGEVRRDFQLLVVDCKAAVPPVVQGKKSGDTGFQLNALNVQFDNTVSDDDRFAYIIITDSDAVRSVDSFKENITIKAVPLNFKGSVTSIQFDPQDGVLHKYDTQHSDTLLAKVFFPACPFFLGGPAQIGVIAYDDACALPLSDTLKINVEIEPPDNQRAVIAPPDKVTATLNEGDQEAWAFEGTDADGDELVLFALADGFSMSKSGMKTEITEQSAGLLKGQLSWDAFCDIYDFTKQTTFNLKLLIDDLDKCDLGDPDTLTYKLNVILPPDNKPIVDTDLTPDPFEIVVDGIERKIYQNLTFNVTGKDIIDNDRVTVRMVGDGFNPTDYGMSFAKKTDVGSVSSEFNWDFPCDKFNLAERDTFNIAFLAIDSVGKCRIRQLDSLVVKVKVLPPPNLAPQLSILNISNDDIAFDGGTATVWPGQQLDLQFNVSDADTGPIDQLNLMMVDVGGDDIPDGWQWQDATGPSVLSSVFSWAPLCTIFKDNIFEHDFYFKFYFEDDRCITAVRDSVTINVKVRDRESSGFEVDPVNVFTPNDDGINDFYSMERRNASGDLENILPPDNCQGVFENIKIYNRWGNPVFTSTDRNFRWFGSNEAAGVYFYHVKFTNREYKGTVSIRD